VQRVLGAEGQAERAQLLDRHPDASRLDPALRGEGQHVFDRRLAADPGVADRVEDLQRELVEPVESARHRQPGLRPMGQRRDVTRRWKNQVRAQPEERRQPVVGQRA
jgi:hypothetical protein